MLVAERSWLRSGGLRWAVAGGFAAATLLYVALWMVAVRYLPAVELGFDSDYLPAERAQLITTVLPDSPAARAGMRAGDRLVAIDGQPLSDVNFQARAWSVRAAGDNVRLTLRGPDASVRDVTATLRHRIPRAVAGGLLTFVAEQIQKLYPLPFVVVGLAVLALRIDDNRAWLLALVFAAFASTPGFPDSIETFAPGLRPFTRVYQGLLIGLFAPLFYTFFAVFPAPSVLERRMPWLKWAVLAIGVPLGIASTATGALRLPAPLTRWMGEDLAERVAIGWLLGTLLLGLASLAANFLAAPDEQARRKTRVMFWGTVIALAPNVAIVAATSLAGLREPQWLSAVRAAFAFVLPLSIAYAVVKHRVLDIPVLIRRGARYLLVQRGFIVLLALASIVVTLAFARWLAPVLSPLVAVAEASGVAAGAALGMLLLWSGSMVHRQVSGRIDRAFFRQAYDARAMLQDLASRATTVTTRAELAALLHHHVTAALHPKTAAVYLRSPDERLRLMAGSWPSAPDELPATGPWLARPGESAVTDRVVTITGREGRAWGVIALGERLSEEPYSREDAELLAVVARQAALALENLALAEEIASRLEAERRHEHELSIARDVQQMLLPQRTPPLVTLDYAGTCTQARVVGGDYYDFLDLGSGRVGFVLADISGKGIAAALLMANLQAIVRSHSTLAAGDHESVLRSVNALFRDSTATNRFATMLFAVYDDQARTLEYVNCGHNPPLLLRANGEVEWLSPTAIAMGFFGDWQCTTESRHLGPGDLLVMYSDGITEAWSAADEEYGEARLLAVARAHRSLPARELADRIVSDVRGFSRAEQADDWTVIVARRLGNTG